MPARLTKILRLLARWLFGATIILIPLHYRFIIQARPLDTIYHDYTDLLLFASDIFLSATLALWLLSLVLDRRAINRGPVFLTAPIAGLTVMSAVSVVFSVDPLISVYHAIRLLLLFGLYLYVLNEIAALSQLILPVVIQVLIQASISVSQILSQHSLGLTSLGELELDPAWSGVSIILADGVRSLRAYGLSDHPNILGGCFAFALILIAGWYSDSNTRWRTMTAMVFALGGIGLLLTFSRSAWLALAGGLLFSALLLGRTRQRQPLREWLMLMVVSFIFLLPWGWHNAAQLGVRFNQQNSFEAVDSIGRAIEGRSLAERNVLNEATSQLFAAHALFGVGLGALPRALHDAYPDFPFYYQPAHIALLDVAAETGSIGALFYFIVMATPWLALGFNRARLTFSPALIAASGTLLALTLVGLFDYYTWLLAPGRLWQWLGWGLWGTIYLASLNGDRCA